MNTKLQTHLKKPCNIMGSAINKLAEEEVKSTQSFLRKLLMKAKQA